VGVERGRRLRLLVGTALGLGSGGSGRIVVSARKLVRRVRGAVAVAGRRRRRLEGLERGDEEEEHEQLLHLLQK
jgi:hypothetical protein